MSSSTSSSDSESKVKPTSRINVATEPNIRIDKKPENIKSTKQRKIIKTEKNKPELTKESPSQKQEHKKPKLIPMDGLDLLTNPKKVHTDASSSISEVQSGGSSSDSDYSFDDSEFIQPEPRRVGDKTGERKEDDTESVHSHASSTRSSVSSHSRTSSSSSSSDSDSDDREPNRNKEKTYEEIQADKQKLLWEWEKYEARLKTKSPRRFTMASNIEDIRQEVKKMKHQYGVQKSIRFFRQGLRMCVSGLEKGNKVFDPIGAKLDGWTEAVEENIEDYDEVFEELHDKYEDSINLPPELRLIMMVAGSGFALHMSKTLFKTPGLEEIMRNNPALKRQIEEEAMRSVHEQNRNDPFFNMMMGSQKRTAQPVPQQQFRTPPPQMQQQQFTRPQPPQMPQQRPSQPQQQSRMQQPSAPQQRRQMRQPAKGGINIDV